MRGATEHAPAPAEGGPATFAVALSRIGGRVQEPLATWVREWYGVRYVDEVTEPGLEAVLPHGAPAEGDVLLSNAAVSRRAHGGAMLVVAGHADCAGKSVADGQHVRDMAAAVRWVQTAVPEFAMRGAFVYATGRVRAVEAAP